MAKKREPSKAEVQSYYEDNGWRATISKYRIAPKDLSVFLGKSKAKKKAKKKPKVEKVKTKKRGPGRPRKTDGPKKKKPRNPVAASSKKVKLKKEPKKKKGKAGRKPNPILIIDKMQSELSRLKGIIQAAA